MIYLLLAEQLVQRSSLVEKLGGVVAGCAFLIELSYLDGREKLSGYDMRALMTY